MSDSGLRSSGRCWSREPEFPLRRIDLFRTSMTVVVQSWFNTLKPPFPAD